MTDDNENDLRARFAQLRDADAARTPVFDELLHRPVRRAPRPRLDPRWLGLAAAAAVVLAVGIGNIRKQRAAEALPYPVDLATTSWKGPTDFLLAVPDNASLGITPKLGETELNWRIQ